MYLACQWVKQQPSFNTTGSDSAPIVATDSNGYVYVVYQTNGVASGQTKTGGTYDIVVFKLDPTNGDCLWVVQQPTFNTSSDDTWCSIATDSSNNIYVSYQTSGQTSGNTRTSSIYDIVVFKLEPVNGNCLWIQQSPIFNTASPAYNERPSIAIDQSGNICVTYVTSNGTVSGQTYAGGNTIYTQGDIVVFKLEPTLGQCIWVSQKVSFNTTGSDYMTNLSIACDSLDNVYVCYITGGTASGQIFTGGRYDIVVFKLDSTGNTSWVAQQPSFNTSSDDNMPAICTDANNFVYVVYYSTGGKASGQTYTGGTQDVVVFKLDPTNGQCLWVAEQPTFNTIAYDWHPTIAATLNDYVLISYRTNGAVSGQSNTGGYDVAVAVLDRATGSLVTIAQNSTFNTSADDGKPSITVDINDNIYVTYSTSGTTAGQINTGSADIVVCKFNIAVSQNPSINLVKSISSQGYNIGDTINYTLVITNDGDVTLTNVNLVDVLLSLNVTIPSLAPAATSTQYGSHVITQADFDAHTVTNTATVTGASPEQYVSDSASATATLGTQHPSIDLTKSAHPLGYNVGDTINYTLVITNNGDVTLTNVNLVDAIAGLNVTLPSLAPAATNSQTGSHLITQVDFDAHILTNTATVTGTCLQQTVSDSASTTTTLGTQNPSIDLTKTALPLGLNVGNIINYTLVVTNNGNVTLTSVQLIDTLLGINITIPSFLPAATNTQTVNHVITQADFDAHILTNIANVTAIDPQQQSVSDSASTTTTLYTQLPSIDLTKSVSPQGLNVGDTLDYTLVITNNGNVTLSSVQLTDILLGINVTIPSLAPTVINTQTGSHVITQADFDTHTLTNTANVTANGPQQQSVSDSAAITTTLGTQNPSIDLTKTALPMGLNVGNIIDYTLVVTNNGNVTLTSVQLIDVLLGINITIPSLAPAVTNTQNSNHVITQADFDAHILTNIANVTATGPQQQSVSDNATTTTTLGTQNPSIDLTKTALPMGLNVGNIIDYTLVITNNGNVTLTSIHLIDILLGINITIPSLAPTAANTQTSSHVIMQVEFDAHTLTNTANVTATGPQQQSVSDSASTTTTLGTQLPSIDLTKSASSQGLNVGDTINYTLVITNNGNVTLTAVHLVDPFLGLNVTVSSLIPMANSIQMGSHVITQIEFDLHSVTNTANVTATGPQQQSVSDSMAITTILGTQIPSLDLTKSVFSHGLNVGDTINYTLVITNNGNVTITNINLVDVLLGLNIVIPSLSPTAINTQLGALMITQTDFNEHLIINIAQVTGISPNQEQVNDQVEVTTILGNQVPSITITKTAIPNGINVGNQITYDIVLNNSGNVTLHDIQLIDPLLNLDITLTSLDPYETYSENIVYYITQSDFDHHTLVNTAQVTCLDPNQSEISKQATTTTVLGVQHPSIGLVKTFNPLGINVGDIIEYTLTATNNGNVSLHDIVLTDTLLSLEVTQALLEPSESIIKSGNYHITQADFDLHNLVNTALVSGRDPLQKKHTSESTVTVVLGEQLPSILITKTATPSGLNVGDTIVYTLVITNNGNVTLSNVKMSDVFLSVNKTYQTLAPNKTQTETITYQITQSDFDQHTITNTAQVTALTPSQQKITSQSTVTTILGNILTGLTLIKTSHPLGLYTGDLIEYSLVITNTGNVTLHDLNIVDTSLGLVVDWPTLAPTDSHTETHRYQITQADFDQHMITNTAQATALTPSQQKITSQSTVTTTLGDILPALTLTKVGQPSGLNTGNFVEYTLITTNTGNVTLHDLQLVDTILGLDIDWPTLAPTESHTEVHQYQITQEDFDQHIITNTAQVTASYYLVNQSNQQIIQNIYGPGVKGRQAYLKNAIDNWLRIHKGLRIKMLKDTVQLNITAEAEFTITLGDQNPSINLIKTTNSIEQYVGGQIEYMITVTNDGNVSLHAVHLTDPLIGIDTTVDSLAPTDNHKETGTYIMTQDDFDHQLVTNVAQVVALDPSDQEISMEVSVSTIPCVVRDTMIRMHDGTLKPIQEIIRGDVVAPGHRVARLCETEVNPKQVVELFVFQPDSLGQHQPDRELTITSNHPIIYAQGRRPARCFTNFKGVSTLIQNGITYLYDLQFDHDGSYFANNVEIQSRTPRSTMGPLPHHLYFDQSLYNEEYVWDSYDHPLKLIESKLRPVKIIRTKKENKVVKREKPNV